MQKSPSQLVEKRELIKESQIHSSQLLYLVKLYYQLLKFVWRIRVCICYFDKNIPITTHLQKKGFTQILEANFRVSFSKIFQNHVII